MQKIQHQISFIMDKLLEEYGPDIYYILGEKNIATDALSWWPNNGKQETTHESTYTKETMSELYDINEIPYGTFPLSFKLIYRYNQEAPLLLEKWSAKNIKGIIFAEAGIL